MRIYYFGEQLLKVFHVIMLILISKYTNPIAVERFTKVVDLQQKRRVIDRSIKLFTTSTTKTAGAPKIVRVTKHEILMGEHYI